MGRSGIDIVFIYDFPHFMYTKGLYSNALENEVGMI